MTSETIKTTGKGKVDNSQDFIAAVTMAEWEQGQKFHNTLKRRKKDVNEWKNMGKIQFHVAEKSAALSATGKPNNQEIGQFNKVHFPAINAPTLSYAKRLYENFDEIMAYRKQEKLFGCNSPMPLVQGWVKWKKAQEAAAAKLAAESALDGMTDEEKEAAIQESKAAKRAEQAAKKLQNWLNVTASLDEMIVAGMFGADDLKRINQAMESMNDAMADQLKIKVA